MHWIDNDKIISKTGFRCKNECKMCSVRQKSTFIKTESVYIILENKMLAIRESELSWMLLRLRS